MLVASPGCSGAHGKTGKRRIAVIPKGATHDFWKSVHAGALKAAEETGVEIIWKAPPTEEDKEAQIKLIDSLVVDGVDGICVAPIDRSALVAPVERAKSQNVPTVVFDSGLEDADAIVSYVATNNRHGGEMAGEYLAKVMGGKGNVLLLRYAAGSESTEQREAGFLDAIKKYPDIKVLDDTQRAGSDGEEALQKSSS
jgi:ribose transport system substrate-binding protein